MKHRIGRALSSLSLVMFLFVGMSHGQQANDIIKVNVPFEFTVGQQTLPAGEYSIVVDASRFLALRDSDGRVLATVLANRIESSGKPKSTKVKFYGYGGQHVLAQIWRQDEDHGYELGRPKPRSYLASGTVAHTETVAAGTRP